MISQPVAAATEPVTRPRSTSAAPAGPFADDRLQIESPRDRLDRLGDARMARQRLLPQARRFAAAGPRRARSAASSTSCAATRANGSATSSATAVVTAAAAIEPWPKRRSTRRCSGARRSPASSPRGSARAAGRRRRRRARRRAASARRSRRSGPWGRLSLAGASAPGRRALVVAASRAWRAVRFGSSQAHRRGGALAAPVTRQTALPTSSATSSAPRLSIATPTGRPRASPVGVEEAGQHVDRLAGRLAVRRTARRPPCSRCAACGSRSRAGRRTRRRANGAGSASPSENARPSERDVCAPSA